MKEFKLIHISWLVTLIITGCMLITSVNVFAQDKKKKERTRIRFEYFKLANGDKNITITLTAGRGRSAQKVGDAEILLTASDNDSTIEMASLPTNAEGILSLNIEKDYVFPLDEDGFTTLEAAFGGNDSLRSSSNDIVVKDINYDITFDIIDSIKTILLYVYETDSEGNEVPIEGLEVLIGVERLYSVLPIGEIETDEDGLGSLEFPDDLPGDDSGTLVIVSKIDEHDDYATVEKRAEIDWGIPVDYTSHALKRQLWTDEAPLWMIASVFVILLGAWYHFFLSISKLRKIKKVAKESSAD